MDRLILFAVLLSGSTFIPALAAGAPTNAEPTNVQQYRQFAMVHEGDSSRGSALFADEQRLGCVKCHSCDGSGRKAGPDLMTIGDKFSRRDIIESVLSPSAIIAVGYSTTVVETKADDEFQGVLKEVTDAWIELMAGDGQRVRIKSGDIREQRGSSLSLMPEGLQVGLTGQEFTDLVEYLVSLKEASHSLTTHHGSPELIPALEKPIALRPFLSEPLQVPPELSASGAIIPAGLVWFGQVPGSPHRFLAVHQAGRIWMVEKAKSGDRTAEFLDLTPVVFSARGPNGLLGLAFHPQFAVNRKYYLKHQVFEEGKIATVLVEREAAPDLEKDSGKPSRRLLKIVSVAEHHNGGCIEFGPDGFLYFGMGDSAPNFDPQGYGQDLRLLFGKMLRIDVDRRDASLPYGIPADNPFRGQPLVRPEIWAYGFREPWRFSFDPVGGALWVADLGQERGDEIDLVHPGQNYGWNVYEGFELFSNGHRKEGAEYVQPLFANRRKYGQSVVGGRVYRGDKRSSFHGVYIFGDYQSKRIWGLTQTNGVLATVRELGSCPQSITCFAADQHGELYATGYEGMIYQLDLTQSEFK